MTRIEISIEEYNGYNEKIKKLENELGEKDNKLNDANEAISALKEGLLYLIEDTTILDRIFRWKSISKTILSELEKDEHS